jgi:hypothetical protein
MSKTELAIAFKKRNLRTYLENSFIYSDKSRKI